ncbi:uncharacterized protein LOC114960085 [Acropora millepora]|uniref:uncharacterized protein LOC114960085 n=1 Tax=Acropora millepora TaxID=45264 RepID=UPI001CF4837F|nr:uncharacterized protein LOC114960085 [Acropora millepora]
METKHKEAKQGNYIYSCGRTGETGKIDYEKRVLTQQFCHEWASVENQEKKGCSYSSDSKVHKKENEDLPKHLKKKKMHIPFQDTTRKSSRDEPSSATYRSQNDPEIKTKESNKDADGGICVSPRPNIDST